MYRSSVQNNFDGLYKRIQRLLLIELPMIENVDYNLIQISWIKKEEERSVGWETCASLNYALFAAQSVFGKGALGPAEHDGITRLLVRVVSCLVRVHLLIFTISVQVFLHFSEASPFQVRLLSYSSFPWAPPTLQRPRALKRRGLLGDQAPQSQTPLSGTVF